MRYTTEKPFEGTNRPTQLSFFNRQTGHSALVQPQLTVGASNDAHEQEANRTADRVMRKTANTEGVQSALPISPIVQRKCAQCEKEDEGKAQRKETTASTGGFAAPPSVSRAIGRSGQSLDSNAKTFMESRFNRSFDSVQVHTDSEAASSARDISARAYTSGNHIVFGEGQYQPHTEGGRHLLAHELTHVVQQEGDNSTINRAVIASNVTCHSTGITNPTMTGAEVVQAITDADSTAIGLLQTAEDALTIALSAVNSGGAVDAAMNLILREELGLDLSNRSQHGLIRQVISRINRVRTTMESGYLRYMCKGGTNVSLVGCSVGSCEGNIAFTCPGNRLVVLCQAFWDTPDMRAPAMLHEVFHIWFHMKHANHTKFANAMCLHGFVTRVNGQGAAFYSCATGAH